MSRAASDPYYDVFGDTAPEEPQDLPPSLGERLAVGPWCPAFGGRREQPQALIAFKSAAAFCSEYVPLSYTIEPFVRSASLYTLTAKTGAGKTAFNVVAALAVATGRADILGREVAKGRVAYLACENPDDIRMRLKIGAFLFNIDLAALGNQIMVLDRRERPEAVCAEMEGLSEEEPFTLVIVDTLAAFFDGKNINDSVEGGEFMRRLRPLTRIPGLPSVIVAAHPVKNATEDNLAPYGSGAILNEVDGNLTLWKNEAGLVSLYWQGKFRGLEFQPVPFRFEITGSPDILDAHGRQVQLPTLLPTMDQTVEDRQNAEADRGRALLRAMIENPAGSQHDYATAINCSKSSVNRTLKRFEKSKLVEQVLDRWMVTAKGRKAIDP